MNKTAIKITVIFFVMIGMAFIGSKVLNQFACKVMDNNLHEVRATLYGDVPKEKRLLVAYGERIEHEIRYGSKEDEYTIQDYLNAGCDSNFCLNLKKGWQYENPLMLFNTAAIYVTYIEESPFYPDIKVFKQLISAGADINKYPYVWAAVFCRGNWLIDMTTKYFQKGEITENEMKNEIASDVKDANRVVKLFLDAGADVNKKGNPIPFDRKKCKAMNEVEVQKYFNSEESTTPLYESIKKGIVWESQVDLLLEYGAKLDESCLEAARLSGDKEMIFKIEKLISAHKN